MEICNMTPLENQLLPSKKNWLLLIHQLPPRPNTFRVKIWRRLQQAGAVPVKQSVYAMPATPQAREDLSWILKEIMDGGGNGSIIEANFVEGLTDNQVVTMFQNARKADYEKLIQEISALMAPKPQGQEDAPTPVWGKPPHIGRLKTRLDEITAIDFFGSLERGTAEMLLKELEILSRQEKRGLKIGQKIRSENLKNKIWVTRRDIFVDRMSCGWLIRKFIDDAAEFRFVSKSRYTPGPQDIRFDMFEGEFTHEGDKCSFEVMAEQLGIQDRGVLVMAEIIHDIDLKENRYERPETEGIKALLTGITAAEADDGLRMQAGFELFNNLYAFFIRQKNK